MRRFYCLLTVPKQPASVDVTEKNSTCVDVTWTPSADNGCPINNYTVSRAMINNVHLCKYNAGIDFEMTMYVFGDMSYIGTYLCISINVLQQHRQ